MENTTKEPLVYNTETVEIRSWSFWCILHCMWWLILFLQRGSWCVPIFYGGQLLKLKLKKKNLICLFDRVVSRTGLWQLLPKCALTHWLNFNYWRGLWSSEIYSMSYWAHTMYLAVKKDNLGFVNKENLLNLYIDLKGLQFWHASLLNGFITRATQSASCPWKRNYF